VTEAADLGLGRVPLPDPIDAGVAAQLPTTLFYRDGTPLKMFSALAYHPPAFDAVRAFSHALGANTRLSMREREMIILRVSVVVDCPYEWQMHSTLSLAKQWVDQGDLDLLADRFPGESSDHWSSRERALLAVATEIASTAAVTAATWASAMATAEVPDILEVIMWAGWYRLLAGVANGFGFAPDSPSLPG
jgi:alkylhydroperoxidase family enzyme